jgi:hypothetical protein
MLAVLKLLVARLWYAFLLPALVGVSVLLPVQCDPSLDPELDKPLFDDPRSREMDPATVKSISPPLGRDLLRPSEVGQN